MAKTIIGVMGPGDGATQKEMANAYELGQLIAKQEWVLLTGGRNVGVMNSASKGAHEAGGLVVGVLPSENNNGMSEFVDIPICTGMGSARNNINILTSDAIIACGLGAGTTSEIMLALKAKKPLILLDPAPSLTEFIKDLSYPLPTIVKSSEQSVTAVKKKLT